MVASINCGGVTSQAVRNLAGNAGALFENKPGLAHTLVALLVNDEWLKACGAESI